MRHRRKMRRLCIANYSCELSAMAGSKLGASGLHRGFGGLTTETSENGVLRYCPLSPDKGGIFAFNLVTGYPLTWSVQAESIAALAWAYGKKRAKLLT